MKIAINEIKINLGRREANLSGIDELIRSISEVGLLNPIIVESERWERQRRGVADSKLEDETALEGVREGCV